MVKYFHLSGSLTSVNTDKKVMIIMVDGNERTFNYQVELPEEWIAKNVGEEIKVVIKDRVIIKVK